MIESLFLFKFKPMISGKKIYYVPGLISALLIPVLFWYYITPYIDFRVTNIIDIRLPSKDKNANADKEKNNIGNFFPLKYDHYTKINIRSNEAKKNSNLYVSEIRKLKNENSKNLGIEFVLNEKNTYGDFVSLLNDFHISKSEYYGIDLETGNLVVSSDYPKSKGFDKKYECLLCNDDFVSIEDFEQNFIQQSYEKIKTSIQNQGNILNNLPEPAYYIFFSFLIFLNISMFSIKERFSN